MQPRRGFLHRCASADAVQQQPGRLASLLLAGAVALRREQRLDLVAEHLGPARRVAGTLCQAKDGTKLKHLLPDPPA
eukprot:7365206-Pyramimonas_sp.AAC.1